MDGATGVVRDAQEAATAWAQDEFGAAELGDARRTARLVRVAATAARCPSERGRVTRVFKRVADRDGAYGFLEDTRIETEAVLRAAKLACAWRCADEEFVFVPTDGSSLTLRDPHRLRGLGPVGGATVARGLEVMNAIAIRPDGTPLGMLGQVWWIRPNKPRRRRRQRPTRGERKGRRARLLARRAARRRGRCSIERKETRFWLQVVEQAREARDQAGVRTRLWFQLDRGADFREMLQCAATCPDWITIRAAQNRRTLVDGEVRQLWQRMENCPRLGCYRLDVPATHGRKARVAEMAVHACQVTLALRDQDMSPRGSVTLYAVLTCERGTTPASEEPIEWLLLTNHPVQTFTDACLVIRGYTCRWRVEDFHKTWKSVCGVEKNELRTSQAIMKWATILACTAMRIERLKHLARTEPELPATVEFTPLELQAIVLLRNPPGYRPGTVPTISTAVRWVADLGGYTGKSSGGPPGAITIGCGLESVRIATTVLQNMAILKAEGKM